MAEQMVYATVLTGTRFRDVSLFLLTLFTVLVIGESAVYSQCTLLPPAPPTSLLVTNVSTAAMPTTTPNAGQASGGSGLVAQWKFDEGSGTIACDSSGNGNNATLVNGPLWTAGLVGNALYFDGVDDNLVVAASNSLNLSGPFTLAAWVNPASAFTDFRSIVTKNYTYYLYASDAGYCGDGSPLGGFSAATAITACQPSPLPANTWTHLALTYDGSVLTLYRNGVAVATSNFSGTLSPSTGTLQIGASQYGEYFKGLIDEVRIYNKPLSVTEIQTIYQQDSGNTSQTVATPIISPSGGSYSGSVSLTMQTATPGASLYYTTDGSTPTQFASLYTGAMTVTSTETVNAKAFATGYNPSAVASASFTVNGTSTGKGKVYYVAKTGSDSNSCAEAQNQDTPKLTLDGGFGCMSSGDTVQVKAGSYAMPTKLPPSGTSWNNPTTVQRFASDAVTTTGLPIINRSYLIFDGINVDATGRTVAIYIAQGSHHIKITNSDICCAQDQGILTGLSAGQSGGLWIANNKFHNIGGPSGDTPGRLDHGIYFGVSALIEGNEFTSITGSCIQTYGPNNTIRFNLCHDTSGSLDNSDEGGGIYVESGASNTLMYDNIFYNLFGKAGGCCGVISVSPADINVKIYNNTLYNNNPVAIKADQSTIEATNNILWNNCRASSCGYANTELSAVGGGRITGSTNLCTSMITGCSVAADPLFVDPGHNNYRLQPRSPAINSGVNLLREGVTLDFDGVSRPQGGAFDIGPFEQ